MTDIRPLEPASGGTTSAAAHRPHLRLDRVQIALLGLMLLRLTLNTLFLLDVLPLDMRDPVYRFYLHHGGDQELMLMMARTALVGAPAEAVVAVGQPMMMIPWVLLLQPGSYIEMVVPMVIVNGYVFGGLSVLLVGGIARAATRSDRIAVWSAALWALLPLAAYGAFFWHPSNVVLRSSAVPEVGWLNGLSDGPATFWLLVSAFLLARLLNKRREARFWPSAALGAALGLTILFRFHLAPAVATGLLMVLIFCGWRPLLAAFGALLVTYLPQAWYNTLIFGIPFTTGYISYGDAINWGGTLHRPLSDLLTHLPVNPRPANILSSVTHFVNSRFWLVIPLGLILAVGGYAMYHLRRQHGWQAVWLLVGLPLAYLLPMLSAYVFRDDIIRFSMPVAPLLLIAAVFAVANFGTQLRVLNARQDAPSGDQSASESAQKE